MKKKRYAQQVGTYNMANGIYSTAVYIVSIYT